MSKRIAVVVALVAAFGGTAAVAIAMWPDRTPEASTPSSGAGTATQAKGGGPVEEAASSDAIADGSPRSRAGQVTPPPAEPPRIGVTKVPGATFTLQPLPAEPPVHVHLRKPPAAGVLFDIDTGEVLWARRATIPRPIASLTKMMTALMIAERDSPGERVLISRNAAHTAGSATGLLPQGRRVPLEALMQALIMISANDAAVALAEHVAGTVPAFVKQMNATAQAMGLGCTRFSTPNGLKDRDNYSCPVDIAALARADLENPRIARIAATQRARPRFPIKGHRMHLANNHYFLSHGLRGLPAATVTGLKTGFTDAAGRCYVTTARLGSRHLGVVLLDSPDPLRQVPRLLAAGFVAAGVRSPSR
jgi:serine-type D-Ala-D-Ala carboxypeptidase (penicillin-binding protein 5/6)